MGCATKTVHNIQPSEPKEPIEPAEGVMLEVPDVKMPEIRMNILDGEISSGSITRNTEDIKKM